jgi:hypothetical protein
MITIVLVISLSVPLLTGGHAATGQQSDATATTERHCGSLSCGMNLPNWPVSHVVLAPIGRAHLSVFLNIALIALPRQDPPPRFAA